MQLHLFFSTASFIDVLRNVDGIRFAMLLFSSSDERLRMDFVEHASSYFNLQCLSMLFVMHIKMFFVVQLGNILQFRCLAFCFAEKAEYTICHIRTILELKKP